VIVLPLSKENTTELGKELRVKLIDIEADRGKIIGDNGELFATSMPFYDVYFDPMASSQYVKEMKRKRTLAL
jgi:cell division protein FtsI/penicillin-binding protein 2